MSVFYKFKATLDYSTVEFDGIQISVAELKKAIIDQKCLGKSANFDLRIINAQTKEVYWDENALIRKNTSVIVVRVPLTKSSPKKQKTADCATRTRHKDKLHLPNTGLDIANGFDLSSMDMSEHQKIQAMMTQSTASYDPSHYVWIKGANQHGRIPDNYRCRKCNQAGHWISRCPNAPITQSDVKKSTGIPKSCMVIVDSPDFPGTLMTPEGRYAVSVVNHAAYMEMGQKIVEQPVKPKIPDELICPLCSDLLTDALMIPCCADSYCDDCIRNHLLESNHECPGCHEKGISPTDLIPNRFLRRKVNSFKDDLTYIKPEMPVAEYSKLEENRKHSMDTFRDDLFPYSPKQIDVETKQAINMNTESTEDLYDFDEASIPSSGSSEVRTETAPNEEVVIMSSSSRSFHESPKHGKMYRDHPQQPPKSNNLLNNTPRPPGTQSWITDSDHENFGERSCNPSEQNRVPIKPQTTISMTLNLPPEFNPMQPPPGYPGEPLSFHGHQQWPPTWPQGLPAPGFDRCLPPGINRNLPRYSSNFFNSPIPPQMNGRWPPSCHRGPALRHFGHQKRGRRPRGKKMVQLSVIRKSYKTGRFLQQP